MKAFKTKNQNVNESSLEKQVRVLSQVSEQMIGHIDLPVVLRLVLDNLVQQLGYAFSGLFLLNNEGKLSLSDVGVHPIVNKIFTTAMGGDLSGVHYFLNDKKNQECYVVKSVVDKKLYESNDLKDFSTAEYIKPSQIPFVQKLTGIKFFVAIPVLLKGAAMGSLIVATRRQDIVEKDKEVLQTFANQISIAIYNAQLFSRVQRQVVELTEQTKNMTAMHELSSLAGSSLNKMKVLQALLDQIPSKLGHLAILGGSLLLHRPNTRDLQPVAFTRTPELPKVINIILRGRLEKISELISKIDDSELLKDVFDRRKEKVFTGLHEMFPNTVSERASRAISKMGKIGSFIAFPIIAGQKAYGVAIYYFAIPKEEVSPRQREILQVCTNHVAAALENSSLFEQLGMQYKTVEHQRKELTVANNRLQALDKTKSEFISIASHQLRTPLTVIKGYLSLILEGTIGTCDTRAMETLQTITGSTDRLVTLVNDLLDISRIERGTMLFEMKPTRLEVLAKDVFDELSNQARSKGLSFTFTGPRPATPLLLLDPMKLRQSILNLIDNAIKYTASGSIEVSVRRVGQEVRFSVKDTGIGMTESTKQNLFQKFNRGEGVSTVNTDGVGLGLFVAKQIIARHEGTIRAQSDGPGKGSTFSFSLPVPQAKKKWYNKIV